MFIDIHAHAYRLRPPFIPFCNPTELLRQWDRIGVERGVVLPIVSPEIYIPQTNEEILEMAATYPDRIIPFCNVDPRALTNSATAPLDRLLRHYRDRGCKGLGEVMVNVPVLDPLVQNLFKHAQDVGFPVIYDGSGQVGGDFGLYDEPGLPQLEYTLQRFPKLRILGHGPLFWAEIGPLDTPAEGRYIFRPDGSHVGRNPTGPIREEGVMPKLMRRYPNLYADLSDPTPHNALSRDPDFGAKFLTEFQDRVLFGTDIITADSPVPIVDLLLEWRDSGRIHETVFKKIAKVNAEQLLGLD